MMWYCSQFLLYNKQCVSAGVFLLTLPCLHCVVYFGIFSIELKLFCHLFIRLSSDVDPVVDTKTQTKHETSYGIQNIRYIFQIMTDAAAIRCTAKYRLFINSLLNSVTVVLLCYVNLLPFTIHCVSKNGIHVVHYNFNAHQPILVSFGRDVAEILCYRMAICYPTSPN